MFLDQLPYGFLNNRINPFCSNDVDGDGDCFYFVILRGKLPCIFAITVFYVNVFSFWETHKKCLWPIIATHSILIQYSLCRDSLV